MKRSILGMLTTRARTPYSARRFAASAPGDTNLKNFGFTIEHVASTALRLLGREADAAAEDAKGGAGATSMAPTSPKEGHS